MVPSLRRRPPGPAQRLPRAFWVLWAGMLANRLGAMVVPFLSPYLTRSQGLSVVATGWVIFGFGAGSLVSYLVGGSLADLLGRRVTVLISMVSTAAMLVTLCYVNGVVGVVATVFALGITTDMYRPAATAIVADIVPPAQRPWAYSQLYWAVNLGFSIATVTGGLLATVGFRWLFWVDAVTCLAFAAVVWWGVTETGHRRSAPGPGSAAPESAAAPGSAAATAGSYLTVLTDRVMLGFTGISVMYAVVFIQGTTTLPLVMSSVGLSSGAYGVAIAANGVTILVAQPLIARGVARLDHSVVAAAGMALLGGGFGVALFAHETWRFALSVVVWSLGEATVMVVAQTIVAQLAPVQLRGRYNGVYGATWSAGLIIGPVLGTWLIGTTGSTALWVACLSTGLAGAVAQLALGPAVRSRGERSAAAGSAADTPTGTPGGAGQAVMDATAG